jgi:HK97 family phage portal protein
VNIFGFSITRQKNIGGAYPVTAGSGGWMNLIREPFTGAWQRNLEVSADTALTHTTVFSCIKLISADISKLRLRLVEQDSNGIWTEVDRNSPFWPVLQKPNRYQTIQQFLAQWIQSKLIHGNTYVLKAYDARPVVSQLYILNPNRVTVLCAPDGSVYYELRGDHLSNIPDETITVPASEIIHDRWNTFFHPLVGTSPLVAAGLAALQGLKIQETSTKFFANGGHPGALITAPTFINEETAARIKEYFDTRFGSGGPDVGKVAVLGDGLQYQPMTVTAEESQLIEQARMNAETVCSAFHVPKYMVGVGDPPTLNNIEALSQYYYSQCLQVLIEDIEKLLDQGLSLPKPLGTEFDTQDGLFRMDTKTKTEAARLAIAAGLSPNEVRKTYFDKGPVDGGESPMLQQQLFSLAALAERDRDKPFSKPRPAAPATPATPAASVGSNVDGNQSPASEDERSSNVVYLRGRLKQKIAARSVRRFA